MAMYSGEYLNPGDELFSTCVHGKVFVDKTDLIQFTNECLGDYSNSRIVVSRPRRFGKTMALSMLCAYYSRGCDSRELFACLNIAKSSSFETHLNSHNVIFMDIQQMYLNAQEAGCLNNFSSYISKEIIQELARLYPDAVLADSKNLPKVLAEIYRVHREKFIFLLDEWDVVYREERHNQKLKNNYTSFLKRLFKGANVAKCIELVYMTGILPIPKEETQSGLNNFREYTMLSPGPLAQYVGFTEPEVEKLCTRFNMPLKDIKQWYEGYQAGSAGPVYCPFSVNNALSDGIIQNYWKKTGTASELLNLLNNIDPSFLDSVKTLVSWNPVDVSVDEDGIDLTNLGDIGSALTALVHLGYLSYNENTGQVFIPNQEVAAEFYKTMRKADQSPICKLASKSLDLLNATLNQNAEKVAEIIEENHDYWGSCFSYNDENSLACIVIISYCEFSLRHYSFFRELKMGKGFADIALIPRIPTKTPILIELKWDKSVDTAIQQIKDRRYYGQLRGYPEILMVGISYEKDIEKEGYKHHTCSIELKKCEW